jgi:hypothetical protein
VAYLDERLARTGPSFELLLERAHVSRDLADPAHAAIDCQWCFERLDEGTAPEIIALVELVRAMGDPETLTALQLKMFAARRLEALLEAFEQGQVSREHVEGYLSNLPRSSLIPKDTCILLLGVSFESARLFAAEQLVRRGEALAVETILQWIEDARLSDADAISLLEVNPNFALEQLEQQAGRRSAARLLEALYHGLDDVIRVGMWVHCDLGWGRVERIENQRTGQQVSRRVVSQGAYTLVVTLRPGEHGETIIVDLPSRTADFQSPGPVYSCGKCRPFFTQRMDIMQRHFESSHRREARRGMVICCEVTERPIELTLLDFEEKPPDVPLI